MQREGPLGGRSKARGLEHDCTGSIACEVRAAHSSHQQQRKSIPLQQCDFSFRDRCTKQAQNWCNPRNTVLCSRGWLATDLVLQG